MTDTRRDIPVGTSAVEIAATPLRIIQEQSVIRRPTCKGYTPCYFLFFISGWQINTPTSYPGDPWVGGRKCNPAYQRNKDSKGKTIITWNFYRTRITGTGSTTYSILIMKWILYRYFDNGRQEKTEIGIVSHRRAVVAQSDVCRLVNDPVWRKECASFSS